MGTVLVDAGASAAYCEGNPAIANGYSWWTRYQGNHVAYAVSAADGDALIESSEVDFATFDSDASTRLGSAYSSRTADVRRAIWKGWTRLAL